MKLLVIGGTIFLGRQLVESACRAGHEVTLFHRGRHNAKLFPDLEKIKGDRNGDLVALRDRRWDAVVDTCGYVPGSVRRMAEGLRGSVDHYTFISSVSVYAKFEREGIDERAAVKTMTADHVSEAEQISTGDRPTAPMYGEWYGALKALCELAAEAVLPGRVLNVRPGLIVGAHDYSDRFTYWVRRVSQGGNVLAPGEPSRRISVIDARDLADWIVRMVERQETGIYNATGPKGGLTMGRLLEEARRISFSDARFTWAGDQFLVEEEVQAWSELPLWIPEELNGIFEVRNDKAIAAGLTFRPLADTIGDTLAWDSTRLPHPALRAGLAPEREQQLLKKLQSRD